MYNRYYIIGKSMEIKNNIGVLQKADTEDMETSAAAWKIT